MHFGRRKLTSNSLLVHYDSTPRNSYSHKMEDGTEKPIAFASRSLAAAERKYSQLDKEGLAIIFGVKKFHPYLFVFLTTSHYSIYSVSQEWCQTWPQLEYNDGPCLWVAISNVQAHIRLRARVNLTVSCFLDLT